ncbi:Aste57867_2134 [Aphanomyces stellatus]|uniref:tRNA pseudouridine synthase n=1 Tax=Aphanomyces stellatus TaxID=120398 RepID=A0A485K9F0_9STRA|nr:hypothetical protein As57867_002129 [Aphanomyces stellatus]VFT79337.1 Aste57867_2134 [Aphanomyces stellatus]
MGPTVRTTNHGVGFTSTTMADPVATAPSAVDSSKKKKRQKKNHGSFLSLGDTSRTYCLTLAYDGSDYQGFQLQDDPSMPVVRTVQLVLEDALRRTTGESIRVRGASRTDKGVHALGQLVAFESRVAGDDDAVFLQALNNRLPVDVVGQSLVRIATDDEYFDPRKASTRKCYIYRVRHGAIRTVLGRHQLWQITKLLDVDAMRAAAAHLANDVEAQDFRMFTPAKELKADKSTRCRVTTVELDDAITHEIQIRVVGDRFLYKMVRSMVGVLVDVGLRKLSPDDVRQMIQSPTPSRLVTTGAPPQGLVLEWIELAEQPAVNDTERVTSRVDATYPSTDWGVDEQTNEDSVDVPNEDSVDVPKEDSVHEAKENSVDEATNDGRHEAEE